MTNRRVDLTGDYETTIYDVARRLLAGGTDPADTVETCGSAPAKRSGKGGKRPIKDPESGSLSFINATASRRLAEIDENLIRTDLSPSQKAKATAERKEIYEALHPETKAGQIRARGMNKALGHNVGTESVPTSFIAATARATGKSRTTVGVDVERGKKINGKALDALSGLTTFIDATGPRLVLHKGCIPGSPAAKTVGPAQFGRPGSRGAPCMNVLEALDDPNLLGASIRDPDSWKPWRALLAAAFGLSLSADELALYRACTGRRVPPGAPASYLWLVIGRRGGKSFAMALIAVFLAVFKDWRKYLSPGERAIVLLVAADREQAKILHRYCQGILSAPILQSLVWNVTASEIELKGGVTIEVVTRSYRSVRGRSVCVAILDELAFWRDDDSANPDSEVLNAVRASMATFGSDAMVVAGSSPYARRGVLWDAFRRWHGKDDARNLVWQAATRTMNPTVSQEFVDAEFERDPASANAEYGANFRSDVAEFVSLDVLEACTAEGLFEIPPVRNTAYLAFCDPSGGSSDSMTLAIAHHDDGIAVLDCLREVRAPFSPESVVEDFCKTLAAYGVGTVVGDRYAGEWPREQFKKRNVDYVPSERVKSDIYRDALPLLNSRNCQLLDIGRLISQFHGLERRTARGGKDSIDHGPGQHDDVANAVAGALVLACRHDVPLNFHVPITGPGRSAWIAEAGFPVSAADGAYDNASAPPGGWPMGSPGALGLDAQLGWSINQRN